MTLTQTVAWIPVSERLPEKSQPVLTAEGANGERPFVGLSYWSQEERCFFILGTEHEISSVTHWAQPIKHPSELKEGA